MKRVIEFIGKLLRLQGYKNVLPDEEVCGLDDKKHSPLPGAGKTPVNFELEAIARSRCRSGRI